MNVTLGNLNVEPRPTYGETVIYIGRQNQANHFGNRFSHITNGTLPTYRVETREEAVQAYREWLKGDYPDLEPERRAWVLKRIQAIAERGDDVKLFCFCTPSLCHGDVLKELIEKAHETLPQV